MLPELTRHWFKILKDRLVDLITYNNDDFVKFTELSRVLDEMPGINMPENTLDTGDRKTLLIYMTWLFNQLIYISIYDEQGDNKQILSKFNLKMQKEVLKIAYIRQRWCYHEMLSAYISVLKQVIEWESSNNNSIVLKFPNIPTTEDLVSIETVLNFPSLIIKKEEHFDNLVFVCSSVLAHNAAQYCNMKRDLGVEAREVMIEIFRRHSLRNKTGSVFFFRKYLSLIAAPNFEDTQFFLSIMHTMAITYKMLPLWNQRTHAIENFQIAVRDFADNVPVTQMDFKQLHNVQRLVTYTSEILFHQMKNELELFKDPAKNSIAQLCSMLQSVLDNNEYTRESIDSLQLLLVFDDPKIVALMKYLVVAELEMTSPFTCNVIESSSSWCRIHSRILETLNKLATETNYENFCVHLDLITECLQLAVQIEFTFMQRHQYSHGMFPESCLCTSIQNLPQPPAMMHFNDWNYKHISLIFFEDLETITQKLLDGIEKYKVDEEIVCCSILICSCILKLSAQSEIKLPMKQILLAIVASPFYKPFKDNSQFKTLGGFVKIFPSLPQKFKAWLDSDGYKCFSLASMSLKQLTQIRISDIHFQCWWLMENIMLYVVTQQIMELKSVLWQYFTSILINNSSQLNNCINWYQKCLMESNAFEPLREVLCLLSRNVLILKVPTENNVFTYFISCDQCQLTETIYPKGEEKDEINRWMAFIRDTKGILVSSDQICWAGNELELKMQLWITQPNTVKIQLIDKIPAMLNHSVKFTKWINSDKGKELSEALFVKDEKILEQLETNLKDIIVSIQRTCPETKTEILNQFIVKLGEIAIQAAYCTDAMLQSLTINLTFTVSTTLHNDENTMVKCLKLFLLFVMQKNSKVVGEASMLAMEMAKRNNVTLSLLFKWHSTFLLRHVMRLAVSNFLQEEASMVGSMTNMTRRLDLAERVRVFLPPNLGTIVAIVLPMALNSPKLQQELENLCIAVNETLLQVIKENFLKIYQDIYTTQSTEICVKFELFLKNVYGLAVGNLLVSNKKNYDQVLIEALVYYDKSPDFVTQVIRLLLKIRPNDTEEVVTAITKRLLGVLLYFEECLTSFECEKVIKKNILLSLGSLVRMLGAERVSTCNYKIISVLMTAMKQKTMDLEKICMDTWMILIKNFEVSSLGPILSTVFVSLESYIGKYPKEVNEIFRYLVVDNMNLLSCHIGDLFFVEKTRVNSDIKQIIVKQMESQRMRDEANFKTKIASFIRRLKSENSDLKIHVYCFQYIKELFQKNRDELNQMICGQVTMDPLIEELLHIIMHNFKSTSNKELLIATSECLGELGAIEPSLLLQNFANAMKFPKTIHSEEFAKMALVQLCRSFTYKSGSKFVDAISMAIQELLRSQHVTVEDHDESDVWLAIPEKMRPQMVPLLSSSYTPYFQPNNFEAQIFYNYASTPLDWSHRWAGLLISYIDDKLTENIKQTKNLLNHIKPSMKNNQQTTSMFLPYILLHTLECNPKTTEAIRKELQFVFDIILGKQNFERDGKEKKTLYVRSAFFEPMKMEKELPENAIKLVAINVAKMIFELFDFLENYRRTEMITNPICPTISKLLNSFNLEELAEVNYKCGEYARAMIYMEEAMKKLSEAEQQDKLSFLTNIYARLDNPDSVEGVKALKISEWSLAERILISDVTGNYQDCAACFARIVQEGDVKFEHIRSMVNSYIALDQPEIALIVYEKMLQKLDEKTQKHLSDEIKAEPLWRLSQFDELEELLADGKFKDSTDWGVLCGQMLLKFRAGDEKDFLSELCNTRLATIKNLKMSGNEDSAYVKNYREIINMHLITEIEKAAFAVRQIRYLAEAEMIMDDDTYQPKTHNDKMKVLEDLVADWEGRLEFIQKNAVLEEPIFCFRRILWNQMKDKLQPLFKNQEVQLNKFIDNNIGELWLKSTSLACKNKMYQQAQFYILNAEAYQPSGLFLEKAKLNWIKGDPNNAFKILKQGTKNLDTSLPNWKSILSQGCLMIARYNAEAVNVDFATNKQLFMKAQIKDCENEKVYLVFAEYMDRHYSIESEITLAKIGRPIDMIDVMKTYCKSMMYGNEFVFQSMPRFLTIWLDTTAQYSSSASREKTVIDKINRTAKEAADSLPLFHFYTALSQIISRICHQSKDTFEVLKAILVKLVNAYPQQSLWFLVPVLKSCHTNRVKRCKEVLNGYEINQNLKIKKLITDFNSLIEQFVKLATAELPNSTRSISIREIVPHLEAEFGRKKSSIIIPIQCNLNLIRDYNQNTFTFADNLITIHSVKSQVCVMKSLQKPRKVTFIGSDGKEYSMLFKSKDDLRIDLRFLEFASVVKEFLHKDPESRRRQLTARTYAVIPLNESCGIIEWVNNLRTYKEVIYSEYLRKNHKVNDSALKSAKDTLKKHEEMVKMYYPALGDYFRQQFPTPQNYYKARAAYIRTTAVMSVIGYIMGLGDRHGENIMFDVQSGETFHVDCNMLFNRGEILTVPETVPFRLTHNMTDAMGVLGIEGPFKKCCENVLRVMQKEKTTLLSYLRPLVYDPLLKNNEEWNRIDCRQNKERVEEEPIANINNIEMRLKGFASKFKGKSAIALSTEGHINFIIGEAMSEKNLATMFRGWMPWM